MALLFWDGVLRGAAAGLFALLALFFARDWKKALSARLGLLLFVAGLFYLTLPATPAAGGGWVLPVQLISMAAPGLFWLFAASWFDDEFKLRSWHYAALAVAILLGLVAYSTVVLWVGEEEWVLQATGVSERVAGSAFHLASLTFVLLGLVASLRGWRADLIEARRRARLSLAFVTGLLIVGIMLAQAPFLISWPLPMAWRLLNAGGMLALAGTFAVATLAWRDPALLAPPAREPPETSPKITPDDSALLTRLDAEMKRERLYRESGLNITAVAARLGAPEYRLRRAINQGLGARNFNAYLNSFRLAEARAALVDPTQHEVPIVTIALDAGFGSLAPFNRAFREAEGCTPSQFRARALGVTTPPH